MNNKKPQFPGTVILSLALLFAASVFSNPATAQTLKLATIAPEGSSWMNQMRDGAKKISERTEGRVTIKLYGGGVQGTARQVQRKMRTGQLHGGAFTPGEMAAFQKDADLYSMPLLFQSMDEVAYVRSKLDDELMGRLEEAGFVSFGFAGGGFAYFMSTDALGTIDDFRGRKVWAPEGDKLSFAALEALGIAPISMPITDVLTGLQTDLLDSVAVSPAGALVFQWHTRLKYITDLPVAYLYASLIVDKKPFSRLSEADQAIVREEFEAVYATFEAEGAAENASAFEALLGAGLESVNPDAGQIPQWRDIVLASLDEQAGKGVVDQGLFDQLLGLLSEFRAGQGNSSP